MAPYPDHADLEKFTDRHASSSASERLTPSYASYPYLLVALWPAPGLDDTRLSYSGLPLELHGTHVADCHVADCRVPAFSIVERSM
jgi:hypothetical protein